MEVLEALAELAKKTRTRIVITARTSFWNTNLPEKKLTEFLNHYGALVFSLRPFDLQHSKNYFEHRFPENIRKIDRAVQIYQGLSKKDAEFAGRGFALSLIADLANDSEGISMAGSSGSGTMGWLMEALCERERLRQELPLSAEEQVGFLSTFAAEVAEGAAPNTELLNLSIAVARPSLDPSTSSSIIEKLKSHPLIEQDTKADIWNFKQEQIQVLLLAERLVRLESKDLLRFVRKAHLGPSTWQDLGEAIVEIQRRNAYGDDRAIAQIVSFLDMMLNFEPDPDEVKAIPDEGSRLPSAVALATVERFLPGGIPRKQRADLLIKLCGGAKIRNLAIRGTVARFDFSEATFENCTFDRVGWVNCRFNSGTTFIRCRWLGGVPAVQCEGLGSISLVEPTHDPEAEAVLNAARVAEGRKKYHSDDLRMDMRAVIAKFITKGGLGLKTIESANLIRGPISVSPHKDEIIDLLKSTILEEHHISGANAGYNIRRDCAEAVKFYAANNVFTGSLRESFEKLEKKLGLI